MQNLKNSGYSETFRREILNAGLNGYNKILEADKLGKKPLYRAKGWQKVLTLACWQEKVQKLVGGKFQVVHICPSHPRE